MNRKKDLNLAMLSSIAAIALVVIFNSSALAHCDTMDGPVVKDALKALENGDVSLVLKWVKENYEEEIQAAFNKTLSVRALDDSARELADKWFLETLVRLHREGEGAPYTGLKPAGSYDEPAVLAADKALEQGSIDALADKIAAHAAAAVREHFEHAMEAKKHMKESVEAGREYVEAYVQYVHYIENLHNSISGAGAHHE